ncbi:MAG: Uma2 family endonuclease [Methylococcaceae bacterium]
MNQILAENLPISSEQYLDGELEAETKHEYIDGEVNAMAGAGDAHAAVSGNAFALIKSHLRGSGCRTYFADMKVRIGKDEAFFYPDVMVCCDPTDQLPEQNYVKNSPKLIIEVLSPSTENKDRGKKFILYRKLPSLEEYVLIDPREYYVEMYRRQADKQWMLFSHEGAESLLEFASIGLRCTLVDLYEDVIFGNDSTEIDKNL